MYILTKMCLSSRNTFIPRIYNVKGDTIKCPASVENDASHYENMSVQYAAFSKSGKMIIFRCKILNFFLIFAPNIDCEYTLEPPH